MTESGAQSPETLRGIAARAFRSRSFVIGFVLTALVALMALVSFFWTPYDVTRLIVADRMLPPSSTHWFGTDHFGRDNFSMIMVGARNSIAVALVAVGIGMGIGVPLGCWAAARGGWLDEALMRFNDLVFAFPALLSAVMITAIFGPGAVNAIIAIGILNVPVFARVPRARGSFRQGKRLVVRRDAGSLEPLRAKFAGQGSAALQIRDRRALVLDAHAFFFQRLAIFAPAADAAVDHVAVAAIGKTQPTATAAGEADVLAGR